MGEVQTAACILKTVRREENFGRLEKNPSESIFDEGCSNEASVSVDESDADESSATVATS